MSDRLQAEGWINGVAYMRCDRAQTAVDEAEARYDAANADREQALARLHEALKAVGPENETPRPRSVTVELRRGGDRIDRDNLIESHSCDSGQTIGLATRGAEWVWLKWSNRWSDSAGREIARLDGMVDAARRALNAEEI